MRISKKLKLLLVIYVAVYLMIGLACFMVDLERYRELSAFGDGVTVVPDRVFLGVVLFLAAELSGKEYRQS